MVEAITNDSIEEDFAYNEFWNEGEIDPISNQKTPENEKKEILNKITTQAEKLIFELGEIDIYTFTQDMFREAIQGLLNLIMFCLERHSDILSEEEKTKLEEIKAFALFVLDNLSLLDSICNQAREISKEMEKHSPDLNMLLKLAKDFLEDFHFFYKKIISTSWISEEMIKDVKSFYKETENDIKDLIKHLEYILDL